MAIDITTTTNSLFSAGAMLLAILLLLGAILHINNLNRVHKLMAILQHKKDVSKSDLYKDMTVPQGSNFTALALSSWIMLFVAIAFLFMLVPTILPHSYMDIGELASNPMGFAIFGLFVAILAAIIILALDNLPEDYRELKLTELYSFYFISKGMKRMIGLTLVALCISVVLSAYIGTIYPAHSMPAELMSLVLLIGSAGILIMPVCREAWEARR